MGLFFSLFEASFPDGHLLLNFFLTVTLRVCWVHLTFEGSLNHLKKVTLNHLADDFLFQQFLCQDDEKLSLIHQSNGLRGFVLRHAFLVWDHGGGGGKFLGMPS